eukprot:CAMPEP_0119571092 /NCGR_PEP_ID=MMETSP1352-20130426/43946_1 /TAXON_ID=265584 /ORGANISM="Stauroneis constricta, Strain CCMP1120" /LENGTH=220 /DNA_ID=CAMNT_0007620771 /DNA_START=687 /DNA_END=1349 /DNA_ORIENTATION=-
MPNYFNIPTLLLVLLCAAVMHDNNAARAFQPNPTPAVPTKTHQATALHYVSSESVPGVTKQIRRKPIIEELSSLDELQFFLQDDDRLTVIKFFADWCKQCKRLEMHYNKMASKLGDGIIARQKVQGDVRFAQVRYSNNIKTMLGDLRILQVPTMQVYYGDRKLWSVSGETNTKSLHAELNRLQQLSNEELETFAEQQDDGLLADAIEDARYDYSFLNEEW